jgi:hypothetical protein
VMLRSLHYLVNREPRDYLDRIQVPMLIVYGRAECSQTTTRFSRGCLVKRRRTRNWCWSPERDFSEADASFKPMMGLRESGGSIQI